MLKRFLRTMISMQKNGRGNDLVGNGVMNQGDRRSINYDTQFARYKIKVEFADGSSFVRRDIELIDVWRLGIRRDGSFDKKRSRLTHELKSARKCGKKFFGLT